MNPDSKEAMIEMAERAAEMIANEFPDRRKPADRKSEELAIASIDEIERYRKSLEEIAECSGLTLLGCNCDDYMHCDCGETAYRAFERGANRAFEQCASTAKSALVQTRREP